MFSLHNPTYYSLAASTYGSNSYNTMNYNGDSGQTTNSAGPLVNTGVAVVGFVTIACVILLVAIIVRAWRRPKA